MQKARWSRGRMILAAVLVLAALSVAACGNDSRASAPAANTSRPANGTEQELTAAVNPDIVAAHNRLGLLVFQHLAEQQQDKAGASADDSAAESIFISPVSIALALSMAFNGAAGETEGAMAEALQLTAFIKAGGPGDSDRTRTEINRANRALLEALTGADLRLDIASSIWHRRDVAFNPAFLKDSRRYYRARVEALDFRAPDSVAVINGWVSDATEGLIPSVIDELDEDQIMLLINAVYFKGDWTTPFDPRQTRDMSFYPVAGERRLVPMMYRVGRIEYLDDGFQAVRLPYGNDERWGMYVFLPPEGTALHDFVAGLDYDTLTDAFGRFEPRQGEVLLPRIDISFKANLNDALEALGMGIAFDPGEADFRRLLPAAGGAPDQAATAGGPNIFMGDVVHRAVLRVDEEGTEAAAVTSVDFRLTSVPVYDFRFQADRPFVVVIRDDTTGALLFVGAVADPAL